MELGKYYLTTKGKVVKVEQAHHIENPILGIGSIGSCDSEFEHIGANDLSFSDAKEIFKQRCVGIGCIEHSSYHFYRDESNPVLFFIFDEDVVEGLSGKPLDYFIEDMIREFECWFNGEVFDIQFFERNEALNVSNGYIRFGYSPDFELDLLCEVDKEVRLLLESDQKDLILAFIEAKFNKSKCDIITQNKIK